MPAFELAANCARRRTSFARSGDLRRHRDLWRGGSSLARLLHGISPSTRGCVASSYFKAIAIDFDGTLTEGGRPEDHVLAALAEARGSGMTLLLVTGRVVSDLLHVFGDAERWFDVIIGENGTVIRRNGVSHALTAPVPLELDRPLVERAVRFERGQVLLACDGVDELIVLEQLRQLGADCQLIRNREALMVLPAGASKGSGLLEALQGLGISHHSVVGIGDAENDLALLRQCELGVAVGNAVQSLKREADIVLTTHAGDAVAEFVRGGLLSDAPLPASRRWRVSLGHSVDGARLTLPASRVNVLFIGGSGVGKSYAAGLFAERLIDLEYSVCVVDPEGDHGPLGRLHGVLTVGDRGAVPSPQDVPELLTQRPGSVVVDLSSLRTSEVKRYMSEVLCALSEERVRSGLPHWLLIDEAHVPFDHDEESFGVLRNQKGLCLATYHPAELCRSSGLAFDYVVAIPGEQGLHPNIAEDLRELLQIDRLPEMPKPHLGDAVLAHLGDAPRTEGLRLGRRFVRHVRHWHKYSDSSLPPASVFQFRTVTGVTGTSANNLSSFRRELLLCDPGVLEHHAAHRDFSHWLEHAIRDEGLARVARELEDRSQMDDSHESLRRGLIEAIENKYLA